MEITHQTIGNIEKVSIRGRLVMACAEMVRQQLNALVEVSDGRLVVDMSEVSFTDSSGLAVLISILKATRARGGNVVLLNPTEAVMSLLKLTHLHQIFTICNDEAMAIAWVEPTASHQPSPC